MFLDSTIAQRLSLKCTNASYVMQYGIAHYERLEVVNIYKNKKFPTSGNPSKTSSRRGVWVCVPMWTTWDKGGGGRQSTGRPDFFGVSGARIGVQHPPRSWAYRNIFRASDVLHAIIQSGRPRQGEGGGGWCLHNGRCWGGKWCPKSLFLLGRIWWMTPYH